MLAPRAHWIVCRAEPRHARAAPRRPAPPRRAGHTRPARGARRSLRRSPGLRSSPSTPQTSNRVATRQAACQVFLGVRIIGRGSTGYPGGREVLLRQAELLLGDVYVHLSLKRAMHGVDPLQRMKLLHGRAAGMADAQFTSQLMEEFRSARDMHTAYSVVQPGERVAVLPFTVERCFVDSHATYLVTELLLGFSHPQFVRGVEVTHWNGIPIERVIETVGDMIAAGNEDARRARGLATLTQRPLRYLPPPVESWVVVSYRTEGQRQDIKFIWQTVTLPPTPPPAVDEHEPAAPRDATRGLDGLVEAQRRARRSLSPPSPDAEHTVDRLRSDRVDESERSTLPEFIHVGTLDHDGRRLGYLRILSFEVPDVDAFVAEVSRLAGLLPGDGLVLDVRGNGGGAIAAAERLLQLFTPRRVEPERFHFANTPLTLRLVESADWLSDWVPSMRRATEIGTIYSDGFPIEQGHTGRCNAIGQVYVGPVVLIVDALCYSATDIFAAGFQDHAIGPVLGVDGNTAGGGANAWIDGFIASVLGAASMGVEPLPDGSAMSVAVRQARRVGPRAGSLVEDFGVQADVVHEPTMADLLQHDADLFRHAGDVLLVAVSEAS